MLWSSYRRVLRRLAASLPLPFEELLEAGLVDVPEEEDTFFGVEEDVLAGLGVR